MLSFFLKNEHHRYHSNYFLLHMKLPCICADIFHVTRHIVLDFKWSEEFSGFTMRTDSRRLKVTQFQ